MKYGRNYGRDLSPWIAVVAVGAAFTFAGCRTGAAPASSPEAAAAQAPRSGETSSGSVVPNTLISPAAPNSTPAFAAAAPSPSPSPTEPSEITAATRRSATGLPEPLPDYMSWYPLSPRGTSPARRRRATCRSDAGTLFTPKARRFSPSPRARSSSSRRKSLRRISYDASALSRGPKPAGSTWASRGTPNATPSRRRTRPAARPVTPARGTLPSRPSNNATGRKAPARRGLEVLRAPARR